MKASDKSLPPKATKNVLTVIEEPAEDNTNVKFKVSRALDTGDADHTNLEEGKNYTFIYALG